MGNWYSECHVLLQQYALFLDWGGTENRTRCAMVFGGVVSRDGLGLGCIGKPGYRAHRSVAMAPMFKGIRNHFAAKFGKW